MSWHQEKSYFMNLSVFPTVETPDCLWSFPKTAEGTNLVANPFARNLGHWLYKVDGFQACR